MIISGQEKHSFPPTRSKTPVLHLETMQPGGTVKEDLSITNTQLGKPLCLSKLRQSEIHWAVDGIVEGESRHKESAAQPPQMSRPGNTPCPTGWRLPSLT